MAVWKFRSVYYLPYINLNGIIRTVCYCYAKQMSKSAAFRYSRPRGRGFEPHQRHYIVSLRNNINPSLIARS